jgi:hypothetical protein
VKRVLLPSEAQAADPLPPRPRGQAPGSKGHGRTPRPHLPVLEQKHVLPLVEQVCIHYSVHEKHELFHNLQFSSLYIGESAVFIFCGDECENKGYFLIKLRYITHSLRHMTQ